MTDIGIIWDNDGGGGQWAIGADGDLMPAASDLETAVMISLFTDGYATDDFTPTDGTTDRRGWWGNTYEAREIGSTLWQLDRAYFSGKADLLLQARDYTKSALQWLLDSGIVANISVTTAKIGKNGLSISITLTEPVSNAKTPFLYSLYWDQTRAALG